MFMWIKTIIKKLEEWDSPKKPQLQLYQEEILSTPSIGDGAKTILRFMFEQPNIWRFEDEYCLYHKPTGITICCDNLSSTDICVAIKYNGVPFIFNFTDEEKLLIQNEYKKFHFNKECEIVKKISNKL